MLEVYSDLRSSFAQENARLLEKEQQHNQGVDFIAISDIARFKDAPNCN